MRNSVVQFEVGQEVALEFSRGGFEKATVTRRTPTGRYVVQTSSGHEYRFDKIGERKLDSWSWWILKPWTAKHDDAIERRKLLNRLIPTNWNKLATNILRDVVALLDSAQ